MKLTHGHAVRGNTTSTYQVWNDMKGRCLRKTYKNYKFYGGRGIKICSRWLRFDNFLDDMGERPSGLTLDRIDNDGNYEPSNCRWATRKEQTRNSRVMHWITISGECLCISDWAEKIGISPSGFSSVAKKYGMTIEEACRRRVTTGHYVLNGKQKK